MAARHLTPGYLTPDIWFRYLTSGHLTSGHLAPDNWLQDNWLRTIDSGKLTLGIWLQDNWLRTRLPINPGVDCRESNVRSQLSWSQMSGVKCRVATHNGYKWWRIGSKNPAWNPRCAIVMWSLAMINGTRFCATIRYTVQCTLPFIYKISATSEPTKAIE